MYASPVYPPPDSVNFVPDDILTHGVLTRRIIAWGIDVVIVGIIVAVLWVPLFLFGILTLGLGLPLLGALPAVPVLYSWITIASPMMATPGQSLLGLRVVRNEDLGPPGALRALATVVLFYVLWAASFVVWVLSIVPVSSRHRMLHDILSGTVVVRAEALTAAMPGWNMRAGGWPPA